jgi:hypothetical protein
MLDERPPILFAPGAGAPSTSAWMSAWADRLETLGGVTRFDYAYQHEGRRRPDPHATLVATHRAALDELFAGTEERVVLAGKSMGSRMGCHVAVEAPERVRCLVCFGYPLRPAAPASSKSASLRESVLRELRTPILFVQGTRDALCPLDALALVRSEMSAPSELVVVETGDHSLLVTAAHRKATGESQADVDERILRAIDTFVRRW